MEIKEQALDLLNQGVTLMKLQKYAEAKEIFQKVVKEEPSYLEAYLHLGNACVNLDEMDEALKAFTSALIVDKNSGETLFSIANVHYLQGDIGNAIKFYVKAENAGYKSSDMYLIMGNIFYDSGDTVQALRYVSRALKEEPLDGSLWRQRILLELELGKIDVALDTLDEFESILPDALDIHELRTRILIQMGEYDKAAQHLDKAAENFPDDTRILLLWLRLNIARENFNDAKVEIENLKKQALGPITCKQVALEEAGIYLQEENAERIISSIDWGLEKCPNDPDLLFVKLNTYIAALDYKNILEMADSLLDNEDVSHTIIACAEFYRALSLRETGNKEEAQKKFKELVKKLRKFTIDSPEELDLFMYRILTHSALGEYDKALELADYLGKVSPNEGDAHAFRSLVYKDMGDQENAERELKAAQKINPNYKG